MGLVLGGLMTEVGWRWTFLLPVPFALAILAAAPRLLHADRAPQRTRGAFYMYSDFGYVASPYGILKFGQQSVSNAMLLTGTMENFNDGGWHGTQSNGSLVLMGWLRARVWSSRRTKKRQRPLPRKC